ncbi:uncharacterized protein [Ptychodera flava]|uniref:uncharacterized protein n=1 Tax=Ptychodera flava TaxID=63121 RepID=UPI00396AA0CC
MSQSRDLINITIGSIALLILISCVFVSGIVINDPVITLVLVILSLIILVFFIYSVYKLTKWFNNEPNATNTGRISRNTPVDDTVDPRNSIEMTPPSTWQEGHTFQNGNPPPYSEYETSNFTIGATSEGMGRSDQSLSAVTEGAACSVVATNIPIGVHHHTSNELFDTINEPDILKSGDLPHDGQDASGSSQDQRNNESRQPSAIDGVYLSLSSGYENVGFVSDGHRVSLQTSTEQMSTTTV